VAINQVCIVCRHYDLHCTPNATAAADAVAVTPVKMSETGATIACT